MELIVIGSGTGALRSSRGPSGYVLRLADDVLLLDGGTGTLRKCLETDISYKDIDKVFYTHLHPDHTIDLVPLLFATKHTPGFRREKALRFYGPVGFQDFYDAITSLYGTGITDVEYEIEVTELAAATLAFDEYRVETELMRHAKNAIGYRFESEGRVFVYSGDTDYCEGIVNLARNADGLLLECSFPDDMKVPGHLTPSEAGRIATEAGAKQLILTHFYPVCDQTDVLAACAKWYRGPVLKAFDLMRIEI